MDKYIGKLLGGRYEIIDVVGVGGMAVVAHGYGRMTADIDLVVQLKRDNILKALEALAALGFHPRAPVKAEQFADEETRKRWIRLRCA